jgi:hypothetical protein
MTAMPETAAQLRCDTRETVTSLPARLCNERYSALMKHTKQLPLLLASFLVASLAPAQTRDGRAINSAQANNAIAAARSQYTQTSDISPGASNTTLAQLHRGGPARRLPTQRGYPRPTYQTPWMDHGNAKHIVIGAAIGFGIGAAIGANNSARNGTPVGGGIIIGGGLFGFLGGCAGKAVGDLQGIHFASSHRRRTYRPSGPEGDEVGEVRSHSKARKGYPEQSVSEKPALLGQAARVEAMSPPSLGVPAVP